jgi:hypothetical protein
MGCLCKHVVVKGRIQHLFCGGFLEFDPLSRELTDLEEAVSLVHSRHRDSLVLIQSQTNQR